MFMQQRMFRKEVEGTMVGGISGRPMRAVMMAQEDGEEPRCTSYIQLAFRETRITW